METIENENIRESVRETYGQVARAGGVDFGVSQETSCCGPSNVSTETSVAGSCGCGDPNLTLEQMSAVMGYSKEDMDVVPNGANMGLGCGNPVALSSLKPGETVVDLGSGGGFDCFLAAKEVGETGKVVGVDMTPDMVSKARKNAEKAEIHNVEFRLGEIEQIPVADNSADIIMSNCVINLSPEKLRVYQEAFRVLKPGGRLAISDIVATASLPEEIRNDLALVGACVGGAATIDDTEALLKEAGFQDVKIKPNNNSREIFRQWDPAKSKNAGDYVVSAYIEGIKPI
ncbi:MAG: arsenite methyltransferase [Desulfobacteraceae bacterium]|nr:arsenite methyltransferase [Desulfobacteraceae bacterium]